MPDRRFVHVVEARRVAGHRVWLRFDDGCAGEADLAAELAGEVFEPLLDVGYFSRFRIDDGGTLSWPNGADFAPEFLRDLVSRDAAQPAA